MSQNSISERVLDEAFQLPREHRTQFILSHQLLSDSVKEKLLDLLSHHDTLDGSIEDTQPSINELWFGKPLIPGYKLGGIIGVGGMGRVYAGRQIAPSRLVAIKCLKPELARESKSKTRFRREADLMAGLDHPGIVKVFDHVELAETCCIVMQHVRGPRSEKPYSLAQLITERSQGMGQAEVKSVMLQLTDALSYAHKKGVIHRDIKPSNILIDEHSRVRITDFGIALASALGAPNLTSKLSVLGTYDYMSPEQHSGDSIIDARSDVYSLGVMMYQMLTGVIPRGSYQLPGQIRNDQFCGFDACIQCACSSDPEERYAGMDAFRKALNSVHVEGITKAARTPKEPPRAGTNSTSSKSLAVSGVLLLSLAAVGVIAVKQYDEWKATEPLQQAVTEPPFHGDDGKSHDSAIANQERGWIAIPSSGEIEFAKGRVTSTKTGQGAAIYQKWKVGETTRVQVKIIGTVDGQGARDRFGHILFFSDSPGVTRGYGVTVSRTSSRFTNSTLCVFGPDGDIRTFTPNHQWSGDLMLDYVLDTKNESISGTVTYTSGEIFDFKARVGIIDRSLEYFGLQLGGPGRPTSTLPAFENLRLNHAK